MIPYDTRTIPVVNELKALKSKNKNPTSITSEEIERIDKSLDEALKYNYRSILSKEQLPMITGRINYFAIGIYKSKFFVTSDSDDK